MTHKQKALNSLVSATRFFTTAETKEEADKAYAIMQYAVKLYYDTLWVSERVGE